MSRKNKPWRNPANPDYRSPAVDTSTVTAEPAPSARSTHSTDSTGSGQAGSGQAGSGQAAGVTPAAGAGGTPALPTAAAQRPRPEDVEKARLILMEPERGSDGYALAQLLRTADFLDEFVQQARAALRKIDPAKVDAILKQVEIEPVATAPAKRPRGSTHPIMLLYKLAVGAARMHKQVLKATNPSLFTLSPDKADLLGVARQSHDYLAKLNKTKAEYLIAAAVA